jgi:hypothetical protein
MTGSAGGGTLALSPIMAALAAKTRASGRENRGAKGRDAIINFELRFYGEQPRNYPQTTLVLGRMNGSSLRLSYPTCWQRCNHIVRVFSQGFLLCLLPCFA